MWSWWTEKDLQALLPRNMAFLDEAREKTKPGGDGWRNEKEELWVEDTGVWFDRGDWNGIGEEVFMDDILEHVLCFVGQSAGHKSVSELSSVCWNGWRKAEANLSHPI